LKHEQQQQWNLNDEQVVLMHHHLLRYSPLLLGFLAARFVRVRELTRRQRAGEET
jgi:hypothetical protein